MADQDELIQKVVSRSGRKVFIGDLERRRPTKRMTTVRSFAVVRNWENKQKQSNEIGYSNLQCSQVSSRTDNAQPEHNSAEHSHEPLGSQDVQPISDDGDHDVPIPKSDDDDESQRSTSDKGDVVAESHTPQDAPVEFNDIDPMAVDDSPMNDEIPSLDSVENVLNGGEESLSKTASDSALKKPSTRKRQAHHNKGDEEESGDDESNTLRDGTPQKSKSPPQSIGLKSRVNSRQPRSGAKKRVGFGRRMKENKQPRFDEEEYEAQNFVRLFNADRGRKGGSIDVTDLDIVLTNIEEVALEIKNKTDSALNKKMVREAFIQIRQIFSDTIDIYKEKKYLQSATTKTKTRIKKMRQELLNIQDKRKEADTKLRKLKSECNTLEREIKSKEEAYSFLTEFERFQDDIRNSDIGHGEEEVAEDASLPSLLCEASGYLSTETQLRSINDKLQLWLDENNA